MERTIIKGNKALAEVLNVHLCSIQRWKKEGILAPSIICDFRRTIIYDLEKVFECLNHKKAKPGRRAAL